MNVPFNEFLILLGNGLKTYPHSYSYNMHYIWIKFHSLFYIGKPREKFYSVLCKTGNDITLKTHINLRKVIKKKQINKKLMKIKNGVYKP